MTLDVVIVGAGPVGLFLSIELATAGVKPLVLERLPVPDLSIKAASLGAVAAEALERRGLARALDDKYRATMALMLPALKARFGPGAMKKPGGHFSGLFLIDQTLSATCARCRKRRSRSFWPRERVRSPSRFGTASPWTASSRPTRV
jgi:2-polyprenyl-6-methoxyphenol hydroxylase-like FAD-dependent oxidoreductase